MSKDTFTHELMWKADKYMYMYNVKHGIFAFKDNGEYVFFNSDIHPELEAKLRKRRNVVISATVEKGIFDSYVGRCDFESVGTCIYDAYDNSSGKRFVEIGGVHMIDVVKQYIDRVFIFKNRLLFSFFFGDIRHKIDAGRADGEVYMLYTHKKLRGKDAVKQYIDTMYDLLLPLEKRSDSVYMKIWNDYMLEKEYMRKVDDDVYDVIFSLHIYAPSGELIELVDAVKAVIKV
ncbi:MAG: hypothetical protein QXT27_07725 [Pyrobaculum sp.]